MAEYSCEYHPNREAVTKCERCNRMICLKDKQVIRSSHLHSNMHSSFNHYGYSEMVVCPLCYYDVAKEGEELISKFSKGPKIAGSIFGIVFIGALIFMLMDFLSFKQDFESGPGDMKIGIFPFVIFGFMFLGIILFIVIAVKGSSFVESRASQESSRAQQLKQNFLSTVDNTEFKAKYSDQFQLYCYECGTAIGPGVLFCPTCGDSTKDERRDQKLMK